jgi:hypothetical protein
MGHQKLNVVRSRGFAITLPTVGNHFAPQDQPSRAPCLPMIDARMVTGLTESDTFPLPLADLHDGVEFSISFGSILRTQIVELIGIRSLENSRDTFGEDRQIG